MSEQGWLGVVRKFTKLLERKPIRTIIVVVLLVIGIVAYMHYERGTASPPNTITAPGNHNLNVNSNTGTVVQKN